jgi:hypothetical protein
MMSNAFDFGPHFPIKHHRNTRSRKREEVRRRRTHLPPAPPLSPAFALSFSSFFSFSAISFATRLIFASSSAIFFFVLASSGADPRVAMRLRKPSSSSVLIPSLAILASFEGPASAPTMTKEVTPDGAPVMTLLR